MSAREGAPLHGPPNGGLSDARRRRAGAGGGAALEPFPAGLDAIAAACSASDRAALERLRRRLVRERGREAASWAVAGAVRDGASATVVALACWWLATGGLEPRLSAAARGQLERSAAQFDRLNGRRAAASWLFDHVCNYALDDRDHREEFGRPIESLGFYVRWLKWLARHQRRGRRKRPIAPWQSREPKRVMGW